MLLQGNLRQDEFPTLSGGPQGPGGPPDGAAFGRHPAYEEDERQFAGLPGQCSMTCCVEPSDVGFPALCAVDRAAQACASTSCQPLKLATLG